MADALCRSSDSIWYYSKADYDKAVEASKTQLMVLDCYATWCGPCKVIAPKIVE